MKVFIVYGCLFFFFCASYAQTEVVKPTDATQQKESMQMKDRKDSTLPQVRVFPKENINSPTVKYEKNEGAPTPEREIPKENITSPMVRVLVKPEVPPLEEKED